MSKKLSVYVILDRSGSMGGSKWENAVGSINAYVDTLRKEKASAEITVAAFDSDVSYRNEPIANRRINTWGSSNAATNVLSFNVLRDEVSLAKFKDISCDETSPRGGTPLFDATAKVLNMADKKNNKKTVILIMTDGDENTSSTYNIDSIKDRIATCTNRGWEVIFLGAEFNADATASMYGLSKSKVINSSVENLTKNMRSYATGTMNYASGTAIDTTAIREDS